MQVPRLLALLAALLLAATPAQAEERILRYHSDIRIQRDGSLEVAETIRVNAEGTAIRHGIFRDFPTTYRGANELSVRVGFDVLEVQRDGDPEPWVTEGLSNGVRIRIGSGDAFVTPGEHDYLIRYRTSRQLGFFEDHDELYWNVTGTDWAFPIDLAEARITLPQAADWGQRAVYTGPQGATDRNAEVVAERPDEIVFRTTAPLGAREGLTVAVAWPKGIIPAPADDQKIGWWLSDNGPPIVGGLGLLTLFGYFFNAWRRVGRGPPAGTVVPIFSPPDDLSPAAMRYVQLMKSDNRAFAAALIDLGVRGKLRLVEGEKGFFSRASTTIEKRAEAEADLPAPEAGMFRALFAEGDSILMDDENHKRFSSAQKALADNLKKAYEGKLFVRNVSWSLRGLAMLFAAIGVAAAAAILSLPYPPRLAVTAAILGPGAAAVAFLLFRAAKGSGSALSILLRILAGLLAFGALGAGIALFGFALESGRFVPVLLPLLALPLVISAFWWMAAPTREGRTVLDRIAGFEHYLSITEEERLATLHPPEKTPELFEKYLPYAVALKVESKWADRFAGVLAAASAAGHAQAMSWYSGHSDPWNDTGDFVDRIGSSLSSTVASASTAPGSSGGSGGGGSSGGGGGGGGGGGW